MADTTLTYLGNGRDISSCQHINWNLSICHFKCNHAQFAESNWTPFNIIKSQICVNLGHSQSWQATNGFILYKRRTFINVLQLFLVLFMEHMYINARSSVICLTGLQMFLVQVRLRAEVLRNPSSTRPRFELMTSRLWQYISCHWDACSNHSAISDFPEKSEQSSGWNKRYKCEFPFESSQKMWVAYPVNLSYRRTWASFSRD